MLAPPLLAAVASPPVLAAAGLAAAAPVFAAAHSAADALPDPDPGGVMALAEFSPLLPYSIPGQQQKARDSLSRV